ncbi:hypothetical protein FQN50_005901 [Emmonsiellopsis sp. PD_5]|nr:hypothetical protein FQN50_005901 [Emmonsiellopsis sp. PD_5]
MFALQSSKCRSEGEAGKSPKVTPNILPCRIHHDGPVEVSTRYWDPVVDEKDKDTATAYFRGRKLRGRRVPIPDGYHGVLATPTDRTLETQTSKPQNDGYNGDHSHEDEDEEDRELPTTVLETQGTFSEFVVWDHEKAPAADDRFVKGVSEWIRFAEAMHLTPSESLTDPSKVSGKP